jgi:hypothetical protein
MNQGVDNNQDATTVGIEAYITSTEFDLNVDEGIVGRPSVCTY